MTAPDIAAVPQFSGEEKMDKRTELDVEDSYYLLHALVVIWRYKVLVQFKFSTFVTESEAFSCVVTAMRAQGMLTEYKQILLEHLKAALFVSDSTYKAELRRAANDEVLCKIAETLNPSYDSFVQWGLAANDVIPPAFNQIPLYADQDIEGLDVAGQLLRLANSHNSAVDNYNDALHELITLPKAPFVPEKLRVLLRETESDPNERVELNFEGNDDSASRSKKCTSTGDKRSKKARSNSKSIKQEKSDFSNFSNAQLSSDCVTHISNNVLISKDKTIFENKNDRRFSLNQELYDGKQLEDNCTGDFHGQNLNSSSVSLPSFEVYDAAQVASCEKAQQKLDMKRISALSSAEEKSCLKVSEEGKWRRKKSKQKENTKDTCARVRPFLFENGSPGQVKPPRGNPDKRAFKRTSPTFSCPSSVNGMSCAAGLSPQPFSTSVSSRASAHAPLSPNISRFATPQSSNSGYHPLGVVIKRMRTASSGEPTNSHSGYYNRITDGTGLLKTQLSERTYPRVLVSPSQSAAAWSNPARPYYGNPSAAAMGVTVRSSPVSASSSNSGICSSNAGTSVEKVLQSPQLVTNICDTQQHGSRNYSSSPVFLAVGHQQNKIPSRRSSYSSKNSSASNSISIHVSPISTTSNRQAVHAERTISGIDTELNMKDDAFNGISADECVSTKASHFFSFLALEMRLECDEVMAPEHRSAVSPRSSDAVSPLPVQIKHVLNPSDVTPRVSQQLPVLLSYDDSESGEVNLNRVAEPQFINGLIHQDDQEIVGMITSEQCIRLSSVDFLHAICQKEYLLKVAEEVRLMMFLPGTCRVSELC
uniref:ENT domain-containing protein n=1 Tax=Syphacia muris TaxID=451379 RepID=A0A0N5AHD6_9BILA